MAVFGPFVCVRGSVCISKPLGGWLRLVVVAPLKFVPNFREVQPLDFVFLESARRPPIGLGGRVFQILNCPSFLG